jgi:hypothetical protein
MVETSRPPQFIENLVTGDYKEFTDYHPIVIIIVGLY